MSDINDKRFDNLKFFTLEEANELVPRLQMTLAGMLKSHAEILERLDALGRDRLDQDLNEIVEIARGDEELRSRFKAIQKGVEEIEGLGVVFQGMELGLVDFPSIRDGKVIFLCWQAGETEVGHWHETDAGFAGRQPLEASESGKLPRYYN